MSKQSKKKRRGAPTIPSSCPSPAGQEHGPPPPSIDGPFYTPSASPEYDKPMPNLSRFSFDEDPESPSKNKNPIDLIKDSKVDIKVEVEEPEEGGGDPPAPISPKIDPTCPVSGGDPDPLIELNSKFQKLNQDQVMELEEGEIPLNLPNLDSEDEEEKVEERSIAKPSIVEPNYDEKSIKKEFIEQNEDNLDDLNKEKDDGPSRLPPRTLTTIFTSHIDINSTNSKGLENQNCEGSVINEDIGSRMEVDEDEEVEREPERIRQLSPDITSRPVKARQCSPDIAAFTSITNRLKNKFVVVEGSKVKEEKVVVSPDSPETGLIEYGDSQGPSYPPPATPTTSKRSKVAPKSLIALSTRSTTTRPKRTRTRRASISFSEEPRPPPKKKGGGGKSQSVKGGLKKSSSQLLPLVDDPKSLGSINPESTQEFNLNGLKPGTSDQIKVEEPLSKVKEPQSKVKEPQSKVKKPLSEVKKPPSKVKGRKTREPSGPKAYNEQNETPPPILSTPLQPGIKLKGLEPGELLGNELIKKVNEDVGTDEDSSDSEEPEVGQKKRIVYTEEEKRNLYKEGSFLITRVNAENLVLLREPYCVNLDIYMVKKGLNIQKFKGCHLAPDRIYHVSTNSTISLESDTLYQDWLPVYVEVVKKQEAREGLNPERTFVKYYPCDGIAPVMNYISQYQSYSQAFSTCLEITLLEVINPGFMRDHLMKGERDAKNDFYYAWSTICEAIKLFKMNFIEIFNWSEDIQLRLDYFPHLTITSKRSKINVPCAFCTSSSLESVKERLIFEGDRYGPCDFSRTFPKYAKSDEELKTGWIYYACSNCKPNVRIYSQLIHHLYHVFLTMSSNLQALLDPLPYPEGYATKDVMDFYLKDNEFVTQMFLDFKVILGECKRAGVEMKKRKETEMNLQARANPDDVFKSLSDEDRLLLIPGPLKAKVEKFKKMKTEQINVESTITNITTPLRVQENLEKDLVDQSQTQVVVP